MQMHILTAMVNNGIVVTTMTVTQTDYENPWFYKDTPFTSDDIGDFFGYVYLITNKSTGKKYIGKKYSVSYTHLTLPTIQPV